MTDYQEHLIDSPTCVVAFAASGGEFGDLDHYAFGNSLAKLGVAHVLMRDTRDYWYQHGVEGIGDDRAVTNYLTGLLETYPKVLLTGVSSGSYGALKYGQLTAQNVGGGFAPPRLGMIAISPCTGLGEEVFPDFEAHWHHRIRRNPGDRPIVDLKVFYPIGPLCPARAFISNGEGTELDRQMARRIGIVNITMIPGASHAGLGKLMRDRGDFERLFT